ncbi:MULTISPECIES: amidohydrolase family protein [Enterobacter cloacae complex]|uniref:6-methylsalicylate decarboxylase n=1 Tax=Enterobacter genomosp. O TaxID=2364150 RepID=A0A0X4ET08_9ENTR|nr:MULTISPECIES: amidohydrolase family protein [Enterobacter cloacae complex]KUQ84824.1 hydrolase [Enterobacter genomosp. O]KZP71729.1 hydrolase [Enterobacter hormaechei subsp. xiangfangensis]
MSQATDSLARCHCGLIDVHAHCLTPTYKAALAKAGLLTLDGGYPVPEWSPEKALEMMETGNIETMILSVSSPSVGFLKEKEERVALARAINEETAAVIRQYPGRFGGFATLPLPHIKESLTELAHAFDELQFDGVVIETNTDGKYLGNEELTPLFDELNRRKATIFLHPTSPQCFEAVALGRPAPLFEFPVDTARTVIDLLFSNTLKRCPDINLILPHAGGVLPAIARRIALLSGMPSMKPNPKPGEEVLQELQRIYYDVAMSANQPTFDGLRTLAPLTQIVFGSDFPFQPAANVEANIKNFRALNGLSVDEHEGIARGNALRLFPRLHDLQARRPTPGEQ